VATKKLASRARRRVRGGTTVDVPGRAEHRAVVTAFLSAARGGDVDALLALLAPEVVRRADPFAVPSGTTAEIRGARAVADETSVFRARALAAEVAAVDGRPGIVVAPRGRLVALLRVTVDNRRITELEVIADPMRLEQFALAVASGD
jgi:ketosteroid isomerase-like protein